MLSKSASIKPKRQWLGGRRLRLVAAITCSLWLCWGSSKAYKTALMWTSAPPVLATVKVDRGDIAQVVTENGSIEGSDDDVVRCRVESFLGLPVAAMAGNYEPQPSQASRPRTPATANSPASGSTAGATIITAIHAKSQAKSPTESGQAASKSSATSGSIFVESTAAGAQAATETSSNPAAAPDTATAAKRPVIRSFDHSVVPHIPLRSTLPGQGVIASSAPPPPSILSILPEGARVRAGDVVCELDSSAFRQALEVQQLRYVQAKAWVEQARYILEANQIALREYQEGILPQDIELVRQYIDICEAGRDRAARALTWARAVFRKGFRTAANVEADTARLQLAEITLRDAQGMLTRLVKYTSTRILTAHRAKIEAIRADLLSLESSFQLESERKKRIETMIANCTMRAPRDGIVVHANRVNGWGTVEMQIREGLRVYQSQPIFRLLDPHRMHVMARINESQVARVKSGQPVSIHLDAYPDRVMKGSVAEIMPLPSLTKGPLSDVHAFLANVRIESGGFEALRSGLTAELEFLVETRRRVPRVPLEAIRWFGSQTFAAMVVSTTTGLHWLWRPIELGVSDTTFAEVVSGLEPGDRVIAHSEDLPPAGPGQPDPGVMMDLELEEQ
jgi:HlyD family secretion protein